MGRTGGDLAARSAFDRPRLRSIVPEWTQQDGRPMLLLTDPLHLTEHRVAVPPQVALVLSLFDGRRDRPAIALAYRQQSGQPLALHDLDQLIAQLDELLLLDGPMYAAAYQEALAAYRNAPFRPPAMAGRVYPNEAKALTAQLAGWLAAAGRRGPKDVATAHPSAVVCPHIDFARGADVYADVWLPAAAAVRAADLIVVFGTDHHGGPGSITPTYQRYATPCGTLDTDPPVIDALVAALGEEAAFAQELNHRDEHSIELAVVWLQHLLGGRPTPVVPILTGSFAPFTQGEIDAGSYPPIARAVAALREATRGRQVLVVAAADLAHVGPAFGDAEPLDAAAKQASARADEVLLDALCTGSPATFLGPFLADHDARRICGLPPCYLALRFLTGARGVVTGYRQCPADPGFGSLVSIAGVLLG
jgi:MEMO1 family protein